MEWHNINPIIITKALFETMASALDSASGSILSSEALSEYAKHTQLSKQLQGQPSLSRIESQSHGLKRASVM